MKTVKVCEGLERRVNVEEVILGKMIKIVDLSILGVAFMITILNIFAFMAY